MQKKVVRIFCGKLADVGRMVYPPPRQNATTTMLMTIDTRKFLAPTASPSCWSAVANQHGRASADALAGRHVS
jgi:hypothetical protein